MKYKLDLEINEFRSKQVKKRAQVKEISENDVLTELFDRFVGEELDKLIISELNDKIDNLSPGKALAFLSAMD